MTNKFDITNNGFLPDFCDNELPLEFEHYSSLVNHISEDKTNAFEFKNLVRDLPPYSKEKYNVSNLNLRKIKFLYSFLSVVCHRYIWSCMDESLPAEIGIPWVQTSEILGIKTALTHASVDLYNWILIDENKEFSLDNIQTLNTMTGTESEEWFYKIMIAVEQAGGQILRDAISVNSMIETKNNNNIIKLLIDCEKSLEKMSKIIARLYEKCDPEIFYHRIRLYLNGRQYLHIDNSSYWLTYNGGSGAQSSLLQVFDALFSVEHIEHEKTFLDAQLEYMPSAHREYIMQIKNAKSLREYIVDSDDKLMQHFYEEAVKSLMLFRKHHIRIVHYYVVNFNRNMSGTGGTSPIEFLGKVISNTKSSRLELFNAKSISVDSTPEINYDNDKVRYTFLILAISVLIWWIWRGWHSWH